MSPHQFIRLLPLIALLISITASAGVGDDSSWCEDGGGGSGSWWGLILVVIFVFGALAGGGHTMMVVVALIIGATLAQWFGGIIGVFAGAGFLIWIYGTKKEKPITQNSGRIPSQGQLAEKLEESTANDYSKKITSHQKQPPKTDEDAFFVETTTPKPVRQKPDASSRPAYKPMTGRQGDELIARDKSKSSASKTPSMQCQCGKAHSVAADWRGVLRCDACGRLNRVNLDQFTSRQTRKP